MTSKQYEELCRYFVAGLFQIPINRVRSIDAANAGPTQLLSCAHQIDLYWEIETPAARYLHVANAKWAARPVELGDVLLLQQVKTQVGAHKAILMTNLGFTPGVMTAGLEQGIALYLVQPAFDYRRLHRSDAAIIQSQLQSQARLRSGQPVCIHELILKGGQAAAQQASAPEQSTATPLESTPIIRKVFHQQATESNPPSAADVAGDRVAGYQTKQGPPPGMIKK